jgi:hypothetical protein
MPVHQTIRLHSNTEKSKSAETLKPNMIMANIEINNICERIWEKG